ncbi:MAG: glycosyltransferase family 2 protein [Bryobacteraceae bacterium]
MAYSEQAAPPVALVIPALNEAPVIAAMLDAIPPGLFRQVIVADNGSSDGTGPIAAAHGAEVVREPERGYGAACLRAIEQIDAECSIVMFMQADLSEDPAEAVSLVAPILDGRADFVLGSRALGGAEPGALLAHQAMGNALATGLIAAIWGHRYTDLGPFRAIRVDRLRGLGMSERNYGWTIEMQIRAIEEGLRVMEIPVRYRVRAAGENKVSGQLGASFRAGVKILEVIWRLWRRRRRR